MDKDMDVTIYALIDPRDSLPHYVGSSRNVQKRYLHHVKTAGMMNGNMYLCRWLDDVAVVQLKPLLWILERVGIDTHTTWQEAERWWIAYGISKRWPLCNITLGGNAWGGRHSSRTVGGRP